MQNQESCARGTTPAFMLPDTGLVEEVSHERVEEIKGGLKCSITRARNRFRNRPERHGAQGRRARMPNACGQENSEAARMVQFNITQKARVHDQEVDGRHASQRKQPIEAEHRAAWNIATPNQRQPQDRHPALARLVQTVDDAAHGALPPQESTHRTRPGPRSTTSADANRANWPAQAKLVLRQNCRARSGHWMPDLDILSRTY